MTTSPFFSVVIPTYNRPDTIDYCIRSVLAQTFENFEIVLVDDCSTDNTVQRISRYKDERIRLIVLDRASGAQVARNRGIREAKGNWIAFQDSDDEWIAGKLERQYNILQKNGFDPNLALYTDCFRYIPSTGEKSIWLMNDVGDSPTDAYGKLLASPGPMFQGLVTSTEAIHSIGYLDEKVPSYQEWDAAIQLARYCRFIHIKEPLFIYYLHDCMTISKDRRKDVEGYHYILTKYQNDMINILGDVFYKKQVFRNVERAMNYGLWDVAFKLIQGSNCGKAIRGKYAKALIHHRIKPVYLRMKIDIVKRFLKKILNVRRSSVIEKRAD